MGNLNSIATVTKIMRYILQDKIDKEDLFPGVPPDVAISITAKPLNQIPNPPNNGVNIFLYQITPNTAYRNLDIPTRNSNGFIDRNIIFTGVDLHYLVTAYCKQTEEKGNLLDQKLLAYIITTFHEYSILSKTLIRDTIFDQNLEVREEFKDDQDIDIDKQIENIKITLNNISLDELTKIWTSFAKDIPYLTSLSYNVSVIILDKKITIPEPIPVQERNIYSYQNRIPKILSIEPKQVEYSTEPQITIMGQNLSGKDVLVDFGYGVSLGEMPKPLSISDNRLVVEFPPDPRSNEIVLGPKTVKVVHPLQIGKPPFRHKGLETNMLLFEIVPKILNLSSPTVYPGSKLEIGISPPVNVGKDEVNLLIGTLKPVSLKTTNEEEENHPDDDEEESLVEPTNSIKFTIPEFSEEYLNRDYPVRVQINGISSLIKIDNDPTSVNYNKIIPYVSLIPNPNPE